MDHHLRSVGGSSRAAGWRWWYWNLLNAALSVYCFCLFVCFNWRIITLQYCDGFCLDEYELAISIHVSPSILNPSFPTPSLLVVFLF